MSGLFKTEEGREGEGLMGVSETKDGRSIVLETKDLTIRFGGLTAVSHLNLQIRKNVIYGLIGPNGAGKTTVFNLITQHYKPTAGQVLFNGNCLRKAKPAQAVKMGMARTFQNIRLFTGLSARDNVVIAMHMRLDVNWWMSMMGLKNYQKKENAMYAKADKLLKRTGLYEFAEHEAGSLPYGLQRRLEIARALATEPQLLLLDEPAAGMNPQEVTQLTEFIREIRDEFDITVLLIEHHMSLVMNLCEEITAISYGKEIAHGNPENIKNNAQVIEAYLGVDKDAKGK